MRLWKRGNRRKGFTAAVVLSDFRGDAVLIFLMHARYGGAAHSDGGKEGDEKGS